MRFFLTFTLVLFAIVAIPSLRTRAFCPVHRFFKTGPTAQRIEEITTAVKKQSWTEVANLVSQGFDSSEISLAHLETIADIYPLSPFATAFKATSAILSLPEPTGLTAEIAFSIAFFAETSLPDEIAQKTLYWNKDRFGRELQYDSKTKSFFIHLGTYGIPPLGEGRKKIVTKTLLYNKENFEVMARGLTPFDVKEEMEAMKQLRNLPGVLQAEALMKHKDAKTTPKMMTIVTKIYHPGSLNDVIKKSSWHLTLKERLQIANDILTGLASIHSKGLVHRDLGARNYFVDIIGSKPGSRIIKAVVADMGRTIPISRAARKPVQGNRSYLPPEAIDRNNMVGEDYYKSDLFATGCVLWALCFEKSPPWRKQHPYKMECAESKEQYDEFIELLTKAHEEVNHAMSEDPVKKVFESLVVQMTDPNPTKRGNACESQKIVAALLKKLS